MTVKYNWWPDVKRDYFSSDEKLHYQTKKYIKWYINRYGNKGRYDYFKSYWTPIQITELLKDIPEMIEFLI